MTYTYFTLFPTHLFWIGGVGNSSNESIGINDAVTSSDLVSFSLFLSVVVVGVLIIMNVETELVLWVWLEIEEQIFNF